MKKIDSVPDKISADSIDTVPSNPRGEQLKIKTSSPMIATGNTGLI